MRTKIKETAQRSITVDLSRLTELSSFKNMVWLCNNPEKAYDFLKAGLFAPIEQEIENALSEFEEIETINNPLLTRMRSEDARYLQERGLKTVIIDQTEEDGTSLYFCFKEKDNK